MGSNTNQRPQFLPNTTPGYPQPPQFGSPAGHNGQPQIPNWWGGTGSGGSGNPQGGGDATSQASTQQFNQFLNQFMQQGGMQQMMQGMQGGPQWNPYMSLINPNGASYRPPAPPTAPPGYTPNPNGGNPINPTTGQPVNPNGYNPVSPLQPFYPGTAPFAPPGGFPGTITNPSTKPLNSTPPQLGAPPIIPGYKPGGDMMQTMGGFDMTPLVNPQVADQQQFGGSGLEQYTGGMVNSISGPPPGGVIGDPMINTPPIPPPTGGFQGGGQRNVNQYGMPTGGTNLTNVPTQYSGAAYNQFGGQAPGMVNGSYGGFGGQQPGMVNGNYGGYQGQAPGMIGPQNGAWNDPAFLKQLQMGLGGSAQLADAGSADVYGKFATDTQNLLGRKADRDTADLRARYGLGGSSNLGSAAALAEGNFRAENNAQVGVALGNINNQERGLNLQQRGQDLQNYLGSRGLDVNQLGMMAQNNQFGGDLNLRAGIANQGSQLGWQNLMANDRQFGANLGMQGQIANQNSGMDWQRLMANDSQFGANLGLQGAMSNQNAQQNWQQLMSQNNQYQNQYNQNDSQFGANFGQQGANMNNNNWLQNTQQMNQYGLGVANIGMQQQQQQQQQNQFMYDQMMRAYMAQAGWNTPQAENVVKPSGLSQAAGGVSTLLDWWSKYNQNKNA